MAAVSSSLSRWRQPLSDDDRRQPSIEPPALPHRRALAVQIGDQAQDRPRMTPFAVEQIWHAGRPVRVAEKGSTLAMLLEAVARQSRWRRATIRMDTCDAA